MFKANCLPWQELSSLPKLEISKRLSFVIENDQSWIPFIPDLLPIC
jgi:hypothetical protein